MERDSPAGNSPCPSSLPGTKSCLKAWSRLPCPATLGCPSKERFFPPAAAPVLLSTAAAPELLPAASILLLILVMLFCVCLCRTWILISVLITWRARAAGRQHREHSLGWGEPKGGLLSLPGTPRPSQSLADLIPWLTSAQALPNPGCTNSRMPTPSLLSPLHTHSFIFLS